MFIESVEVEQLRCFRAAKLQFRHPDEQRTDSLQAPNVTLLLGNNGAGKSTLLRAVALAALRPVIQSSGYVPFSMVRAAAPTPSARSKGLRAMITGRFVLHPQDGNGQRPPTARPITTKVKILRRGSTEVVDQSRPARQAFWEKIYHDDSPAFLVLGYGATRRVEADESVDLSARQKSRQLRYRRVAGLFEEQMTMVPLNAWLPGLMASNKGRYSQVVSLLNRLLPEDTTFSGARAGGHYIFEHRGVSVPFGAMSDGYRQYVGWIGDLLHHVCMGCPPGKKLVENRGIVLIDEIDLHLHPEWQRTVIPILSKELPKLQFILTSHSPIVVGTLEKANVVVFDVDRNGGSVPMPVSTEVHGLNADQVLTSHAFGLASTRAPDFVKRLESTSSQAQRGDRSAQELFRRMIIYGAAADGITERSVRAPRDIVDAARRLRALESSGTAGKASVALRPAAVRALRKAQSPKAASRQAKKK